MAKAKESVNKSQAIREAQAELPSAKAKEIVAHLKTKGITVTDGLVYQVKKIGKKKSGKKRGPKPKPMTTTPVTKVAPSSNGKLGVGASIALVKSTAEKVGGWGTLKEIVDALA